jgi:hypothetical protein
MSGPGFAGCCSSKPMLTLVIKHELKEDFNALLKEFFVTPAFAAAQIHSDIFKLDARIVATQNFDKIYDNLAQTEPQRS